MSNELDRLIGERVMGWTVRKSDPHDNDYERYSSGWAVSRWNPSTCIKAAWEVVEHLQRSGFRLRLMDQYDSIGMWDCRFYKYPESTLIEYKTSKTACEAICLAALRAVGVSESEIQEAMR